MENASKALIIAGAILLAIAIIGIGMYVFSSASSQVSDADLSKEQIQTFNSKFERYEGTQSGKKVKLLLDTIRTHNLANPDREIYLEKDASGNKGIVPNNSSGTVKGYIEYIKGKIKDDKEYTIKFTYDDNGLIKAVKLFVVKDENGNWVPKTDV